MKKKRLYWYLVSYTYPEVVFREGRPKTLTSWGYDIVQISTPEILPGKDLHALYCGIQRQLEARCCPAREITIRGYKRLPGEDPC
jgi:hypothetical protein